MLDIPFSLETVPASEADIALERLGRAETHRVPVLLGDADVFSAEWAEAVDTFEPPDEVVAEALALDIDGWFSGRVPSAGSPNTMFQRAFAGVMRPLVPARPASNDAMVTMLEAQLAVLEAAGEGTEEEFADIRQIIADVAAEGATVFPDPVAYVTPRRSATLAAGMVEAREPWEVAAWLQHGTYAICAPKPVFVALCKWLWDQHGGRIITASVDSIGFQMDRPIETQGEAEEVLRRFTALGASEVNADHRGSGGESLVGASRLWVWWD